MPFFEDPKNKKTEKTYTRSDFEKFFGDSKSEDPFKRAKSDVDLLKTALEKIKIPAGLLDPFADRLGNMVGTANQLNETFLQTRGRITEIMDASANAAAGISRLGGKAEDMADIFSSVSLAARRNVVASSEDVSKLFASQQLLGINAKTLVDQFLNVGTQFSQVGKQIESSIAYIQSVGGNAKEVMQAVVDNTDKLNQYSFDKGVLGLTKMATQAAMMRIDMGQTFTLAEKALKPEGAIETASIFQRLGISIGTLTDPFALINKSLTDPGGLQQSLINSVKQFAFFNDEAKQFQINPAGMLMIREMAGELGLSATELSKAAISAQDLEKRLSSLSPEIKFKSEEDKQYLMNIATMNEEGKYEVTLKDNVKSELGALNQDQIDELIEEQKKPQKSVEQLLKDQMGVVETFRNDFKAAADKIIYTIVNQDTVRRGTERIRGGAVSVMDALERAIPNTKELQGKITEIYAEFNAAKNKGASGDYLKNLLESGLKTYYNRFETELSKDPNSKDSKKLLGIVKDYFSGLGSNGGNFDMKELGKELYKGASEGVSEGITKGFTKQSHNDAIIRPEQKQIIIPDKDDHILLTKNYGEDKKRTDDKFSTKDVQEFKPIINVAVQGKDITFEKQINYLSNFESLANLHLKTNSVLEKIESDLKKPQPTPNIQIKNPNTNNQNNPIIIKKEDSKVDNKVDNKNTDTSLTLIESINNVGSKIDNGITKITDKLDSKPKVEKNPIEVKLQKEKSEKQVVEITNEEQKENITLLTKLISTVESYRDQSKTDKKFETHDYTPSLDKIYNNQIKSTDLFSQMMENLTKTPTQKTDKKIESQNYSSLLDKISNNQDKLNNLISKITENLNKPQPQKTDKKIESFDYSSFLDKVYNNQIKSTDLLSQMIENFSKAKPQQTDKKIEVSDYSSYLDKIYSNQIKSADLLSQMIENFSKAKPQQTDKKIEVSDYSSFLDKIYESQTKSADLLSQMINNLQKIELSPIIKIDEKNKENKTENIKPVEKPIQEPQTKRSLEITDYTTHLEKILNNQVKGGDLLSEMVVKLSKPQPNQIVTISDNKTQNTTNTKENFSQTKKTTGNEPIYSKLDLLAQEIVDILKKENKTILTKDKLSEQKIDGSKTNLIETKITKEIPISYEIKTDGIEKVMKEGNDRLINALSSNLTKDKQNYQIQTLETQTKGTETISKKIVDTTSNIKQSIKVDFENPLTIKIDAPANLNTQEAQKFFDGMVNSPSFQQYVKLTIENNLLNKIGSGGIQKGIVPNSTYNK